MSRSFTKLPWKGGYLVFGGGYHGHYIGKPLKGETMAVATKVGVAASPGSIGGTFQIANQQAKKRLIVAVDGLEKEGKTHFALTAPGPIAYQSIDIGDEGVVEQFQSVKLIHKADYNMPPLQKGTSPEAQMALMGPVWENFLSDFRLAVGHVKTGKVRTIIWDTASEVWELMRVARLGKLTQVMPHNYVALNAEFRGLIREIYDSSANMVLLHKLKAEWKDNPTTGKGSKTGGYERAGFADTGFLVQINCTAWREKNPETGMRTGPFHLTVRDCRQNPQVADKGGPVGLDLTDEMASFSWLGVNVYPDTVLEDWQ